MTKFIRVAGLLIGSAIFGIATASAGILDPRLANLAASPASQVRSLPEAFLPAPPNPFSPRLNITGRVQVYILPVSPTAPLPVTQEIAALDAIKIKPSPLLHLIQAWVPVSELHSLASLPDVGRVTVPAYAAIHPPIGSGQLPFPISNQVATGLAIDAAAVQAMQANLLQNVNAIGTGIKIGVISDDNSGLAASQAAGYLPANVWSDPTYPGTTATPGDPAEGTAMLEEVHAMAPNASLGFCGPATSADFVTCYQDFVSWGANIIVDDLGFPGTDMFTIGFANDGSFAYSIAQITQANPKIAFVSASGNDSQDYFQAPYIADPACTINGINYSSCMDFGTALGGSSANAIQVTFYTTNAFNPIMEWNDPLGSSPDQFILYLVNASGAVLAKSSSGTTADGRPGVALSYTPATAGESDYIEVACQSCANPVTLKIMGWGDGAVQFFDGTAGSVQAGQKVAAGVIATAAVGVTTSNPLAVNLEPFSAIGPFLYGDFGATATLSKPDLTGVDDVTVSGAGGFGGGPTPTGVQFCGTSATSPNVGALIADMMSADPGQPASFYETALENAASQTVFGTTPSTACDPNGNYLVTGYNTASAGAGLAQGFAALKSFFTFPSTSVTAPIQVADGTSGSYTLPVNLGIPFTAAVMAGTNAAVASNCKWSAGTATASSATVKVTFPSAGSYTVTVNCPDSQGILDPTPPTVNVTAKNIPPPTVAISGNSQSSFNLTLTGYEPLTMTASSSNQTIISNSGITFFNGCGTSTLNCSAALSPAAQANGSTTITITATDPFGQTGNASISETYAPPKSGGGGSMGWLVLIPLGGLVLLRSHMRRQRGRRNAALLSIGMLCLLTFGSTHAGTLDPRLAALISKATPAPHAASARQTQNPFAPRVDSSGRVQVYILPDSPTAAFPGNAELAALGAMSIKPSEALHLVQAWVPIGSLRAIAALPDVGRVTVPTYAVPQRATVNSNGEGSPTKRTGGGSVSAVTLLFLSAMLVSSRLFMTDQAKFFGNRRSRSGSEGHGSTRSRCRTS